MSLTDLHLRLIQADLSCSNYICSNFSRQAKHDGKHIIAVTSKMEKLFEKKKITKIALLSLVTSEL